MSIPHVQGPICTNNPALRYSRILHTNLLTLTSLDHA